MTYIYIYILPAFRLLRYIYYIDTYISYTVMTRHVGTVPSRPLDWTYYDRLWCTRSLDDRATQHPHDSWIIVKTVHYIIKYIIKIITSHCIVYDMSRKINLLLRSPNRCERLEIRFLKIIHLNDIICLLDIMRTIKDEDKVRI